MISTRRVIGVLLVLLLTLTITFIVVFRIRGYNVVITTTNSMIPAIEKNSLSVMKICDIEEIEVGDVIVYRHSNYNVIHRVIEKYINRYGEIILVTKGDDNHTKDNVKVYSRILIGKVIKTYNGVAPIIEKMTTSTGELNIKGITEASITITIIGGLFGMLMESRKYRNKHKNEE